MAIRPPSGMLRVLIRRESATGQDGEGGEGAPAGGAPAGGGEREQGSSEGGSPESPSRGPTVSGCAGWVTHYGENGYPNLMRAPRADPTGQRWQLESAETREGHAIRRCDRGGRAGYIWGRRAKWRGEGSEFGVVDAWQSGWGWGVGKSGEASSDTTRLGSCL